MIGFLPTSEPTAIHRSGSDQIEGNDQTITARLAGIRSVLLALAVMAVAPPILAQSNAKACRGLSGQSGAAAPSVQTLAREGGLVYLFAHRQRVAHPYACASYYLDHGLDIDAKDPRPGYRPLTALTYAIRQNDVQLTRYVIQHGANLYKPADRAGLKPLAYAYHLALENTSVDRNTIIGILSDALDRQEQKSG